MIETCRGYLLHHIAPVHQGTRATLTGIAQRQRAGLITLRSLDRNELPVSNSFSSFTEAIRCNIVTPKQLSWRAAYRRIIPRQSNVRKFDGYLFLIKRQALDRYRRVVLTGVAQRKRAGLITPRSSDRNGPPVFFIYKVSNLIKIK